jgi:hypothetical protein
MQITTPLIATLGLIMSALTLQGAFTPQTRITTSQSITVPGNYVLANDITSATIGIHIQASNVILNLNGHTITAVDGIWIDQFDTIGSPLVNARVSNGRIVTTGYAITITGSDCLVTGLNLTVGQSEFGFNIEHGQYNHVHDCVLTGQHARTPFSLFLTSNNVIQNCTLVGTFLDTIEEQDQAGTITVVGNNTFSGLQWAKPTL